MPSLTETSDALRANLEETAVDHVEIPEEHQLLCDLVTEYRGIHRGIEELLFEISHPYRNWILLLPRLRAFVLKNSQIYCRSEHGPAAFQQFTSLFFRSSANPLAMSSFAAWPWNHFLPMWSAFYR